jgi:hypothetical protein
MIGMFETMNDKRTFALADIRMIGPRKLGAAQLYFCELTFRNGDDVRLLDAEAQELLERPIQIMPAEPGTQIVCLLEEDEVYYKPVIGWALCFDGQVRPMTPAGVDKSYMGSSDTYGASYIRLPSGVVMCDVPGDGIFDSVDDLVSERGAARRHRAAIQERDAAEGLDA